jgi:hypothetical protein
MMKPIVLVAVAALGVSVAAAGPVNHRERHQRHRIRQGVASGELTKRETTRLAQQQAAVRAEEYVYRHTGGGLSWRERADLHRDLNRASRSIYRQKHDAQDR